MRRYRLTLRHDAGTVRITVVSASLKSAIQTVCTAERAPVCAIIRRERLRLDRN